MQTSTAVLLIAAVCMLGVSASKLNDRMLCITCHAVMHRASLNLPDRQVRVTRPCMH